MRNQTARAQLDGLLQRALQAADASIEQSRARTTPVQLEAQQSAPVKAKQGKQGEKGEAGRGKQGERGERGEPGRIPRHEWLGTKLRWENPDGSWGRWVDLEGMPGIGLRGRDGVSVYDARIEDGELVLYLTDGSRVVSGAVGGGGDAEELRLPAGEDIAAGDVLVTDAAGSVRRASNQVLEHAQMTFAVARTGGSEGSDIVVVIGGEIEHAGWDFDPQTAVFLGEDGALSASPGEGVFLMQIGHARTATRVVVRPQIPIILSN